MLLSELLTTLRTGLSCAGDRETVLRQAADLLACQQVASHELHESLVRRETLGSTGIGCGVAIPHGRTSALHEPRAALLKLAAPVDFGAIDGQAVDLVFALAVPQHYTHQHLMLLSELAERFSDPEFRATLRGAGDPGSLLAGMAGAPIRSSHLGDIDIGQNRASDSVFPSSTT